MNRLQKILNLVRKTRDKVVILDTYEDADFLLMPLAEYEKMIDNKSGVTNLTEGELLDKINRDINLWKNFRRECVGEENLMSNYYSHEDFDSDTTDEYKEETEDWDNYNRFNKDKLLEQKNEILNEKLETTENLFFDNEAEGENIGEKNEKTLKYENIPPPPDLAPKTNFTPDIEDKKPVIDASFDEPITENNVFNEDEEDNQFKEEPVY